MRKFHMKRLTENIADIVQSVEENLGLPILRRSLQLGIAQTSLHGILHLDIKAYKVQLTEKLQQAHWVLEMHKNYHEFHRNIILTDETHFYLNGCVNRQN